MTNLQNPPINPHVNAVEIDRVVDNILLQLNLNVSWMTHGYARAYRHIKRKDGALLYFPEVYTGKHDEKHKYYRPTFDNDKKGMCFFVVEKGVHQNHEQNQSTYIKHRVGLVVQANMELIDPVLLETDDFTQNLIIDVRDTLTYQTLGQGYRLKIIEECTEWNEIYREFTLDETQNWLMAPYTAFRINFDVSFQNDCPEPIGAGRCSALNQNISLNEKLQCILPSLDFSDPNVFNALNAQQKSDLSAQLCS